MSQLMKCLPHKHKDLAQIPSTHTKNWTRSFEPIPPMLKDGKGKSQGIPSGLLVRQLRSIKWMNFMLCEILFPKSEKWYMHGLLSFTLTDTHLHTLILTHIIHVQGGTNTPYSHCKIHFNLLDTVELNLSDHWGNIKLTKHILKNQKPNSWVKQHQNAGKCWQWVILFTIRYV